MRSRVLWLGVLVIFLCVLVVLALGGLLPFFTIVGTSIILLLLFLSHVLSIGRQRRKTRAALQDVLKILEDAGWNEKQKTPKAP